MIERALTFLICIELVNLEIAKIMKRFNICIKFKYLNGENASQTNEPNENFLTIK